jgi:hypothetical protein
MVDSMGESAVTKLFSPILQNVFSRQQKAWMKQSVFYFDILGNEDDFTIGKVNGK